MGKKQKHATSWDTNIHATSLDKKKLGNLLGQKKSCNLSEQKKIMQPVGTKESIILGQKKSCNLCGQKNHATSRDIKKSRNLLGRKIMQPLVTKKITQPLG